MPLSPEEKNRLEKDVIFLIILLILISILILYLIKDNIGEIVRYILIVDSYIGIGINKISNLIGINLYPSSEKLLKYYADIDRVYCDVSTFKCYGGIDGKWYDIIDKGLSYFYYINIFISLSFITVLYLFLNKIKSSIGKGISNINKILNPKLKLYFNDDILQNIKRKTITFGGKKRFALKDYFPPFQEDDSEILNSYVNNSIDYSKHEINWNINRYRSIEKVWKSILQPYIKRDKNGKVIITTELYALKRWEFIDKDSVIDNSRERMIFVNKDNLRYPGIPMSNLFTSKNSNKTIKLYLKTYYPSLYKEGDDIDFTEQILNDLTIYFEVKHFRYGKYNKTIYNKVKMGQDVESPLIYKRLMTDQDILEVVNKEIEENYNNIQDKKSLREKLFKEQKIVLKQANKKYDQAAIKYYKNIKYLITGERGQIGFYQPIVPRTYILKPIQNKTLDQFETPGIKIVVDILKKYIINEYNESIKGQIDKLEREIIEAKRELRGGGNRDAIEKEIEVNSAIVNELKNSLDVNNDDARIKKLKDLKNRHRYEETYVISLWEYGMSLQNMPTGRLSVLKKENIVLWYALTSLGRPFNYNAGLPIEVMRQYEKELYSSKNEITKIYEDIKIESIKDIFDEDFYKKIMNESL